MGITCVAPLCRAGASPQDAELFTQLAGLEVEALTCPSVTSRVGPSRRTADQCDCPWRPSPPTPAGIPEGRWWSLLMGRWKWPTASLSTCQGHHGTARTPPPSTAHQLEPGEGGFFSFLWMSPTPSPKPRLIIGLGRVRLTGAWPGTSSRPTLRVCVFIAPGSS